MRLSTSIHQTRLYSLVELSTGGRVVCTTTMERGVTVSDKRVAELKRKFLHKVKT